MPPKKKKKVKASIEVGSDCQLSTDSQASNRPSTRQFPNGSTLVVDSRERQLKHRRCRQPPKSGSDSEPLENDNSPNRSVKRCKTDSLATSTPTDHDPSEDDFSHPDIEHESSQLLLATDSDCPYDNRPTCVKRIFYHCGDAPQTSTGEDTSEYGSDFVSGGNLLKWGATPYDSSGKICAYYSLNLMFSIMSLICLFVSAEEEPFSGAEALEVDQVFETAEETDSSSCSSVVSVSSVTSLNMARPHISLVDTILEEVEVTPACNEEILTTVSKSQDAATAPISEISDDTDDIEIDQSVVPPRREQVI